MNRPAVEARPARPMGVKGMRFSNPTCAPQVHEIVRPNWNSVTSYSRPQVGHRMAILSSVLRSVRAQGGEGLTAVGTSPDHDPADRVRVADIQ